MQSKQERSRIAREGRQEPISAFVRPLPRIRVQEYNFLSQTYQLTRRVITHSLPLFDGLMPIQPFVELAAVFGSLTLLVYRLHRLGYRFNKLFQSVAAVAIVYWYLRYRIYPPLPFSIFATYMAGACLAIWAWVSSNEEYWEDFRRPLIQVMDAHTKRTRVIRTVMLVLLPLVMAGWTYGVLVPPDPSTTAPVELRTYHPAPPAEIIVYSPEDFRRCRESRDGLRRFTAERMTKDYVAIYASTRDQVLDCDE